MAQDRANQVTIHNTASTKGDGMTNEEIFARIANMQFNYEAIPVSGNTSPEIQQLIDVIVDKFDISNPEAALSFGEECLGSRNSVAERLFNAGVGDRMAFVKDPLQKAIDAMNPDMLLALGNRVQLALGSGVGVVKRNWKIAAATAAFSIVSAPLALVAGGAAMAVREKIEAKKREGEPPSLDAIGLEIRQHIAGFAPQMRGLELAKSQIPSQRKDINEMGYANLTGVKALAIYIAAGKAIQGKLITEVTSAQEAQNPEQAHLLNRTKSALEGRLGVLDSGRNAGLEDIVHLAVQAQALVDAENSLQSILTSEAKTHISRLVVQGLALETAQVADMAAAFRERAHKANLQTTALVGMAAKRAASGQVDSPEQLQRTLEGATAIAGMLRNLLEDVNTRESRKDGLQLAITGQINQVLQTQAQLAANTNSHYAQPENQISGPPAQSMLPR